MLSTILAVIGAATVSYLFVYKLLPRLEGGKG